MRDVPTVMGTAEQAWLIVAYLAILMGTFVVLNGLFVLAMLILRKLRDRGTILPAHLDAVVLLDAEDRANADPCPACQFAREAGRDTWERHALRYHAR